MNPSATARLAADLVEAEVLTITSRLVAPYRLSGGEITTHTAVVVRLVDADGAVGWGEADALGGFTGETPRSIREDLVERMLPALLAERAPSPAFADTLLDELFGARLNAKGAISMAMLDLAGKRLGVPASTLLGGVQRTTFPLLWPLSNGAPREDIDVIDERRAAGYRTFGLKMGSAPPDHELQRLSALGERYGDDIILVGDPNQGWTLDEARSFVASDAARRLAFFEQPIHREDLVGMAELAAASSLRISADESVITLEDAGRFAAAGAADVFSIKSTKNGGPLRAQRIAAVARAFGIECFFNSMIEFGITQAASLQHAVTTSGIVDAGQAFMSTLRLIDDPTDFATNIRDGVVTLPDRPGLGVEVDEARLRRLADDVVVVRRP